MSLANAGHNGRLRKKSMNSAWFHGWVGSSTLKKKKNEYKMSIWEYKPGF